MIVFSVIYENVPVATNQQIQNFIFLKYVKICAEKNFFDRDFLRKHEKIRRKLPVSLYVLKTSLTHFRAMF